MPLLVTPLDLMLRLWVKIPPDLVLRHQKIRSGVGISRFMIFFLQNTELAPKKTIMPRSSIGAPEFVSLDVKRPQIVLKLAKFSLRVQ